MQGKFELTNHHFHRNRANMSGREAKSKTKNQHEIATIFHYNVHWNVKRGYLGATSTIYAIAEPASTSKFTAMSYFTFFKTTRQSEFSLTSIWWQHEKTIQLLGTKWMQLLLDVASWYSTNGSTLYRIFTSLSFVLCTFFFALSYSPL